MEILVQGETLVLLPERAIWWPSKKTILVSDIHWGKSAHFRKHGIPMPGATQAQDGVRLASIIHSFKAEKLIVAGDLFHSHHNNEVAEFAGWRNAHRELHIDFILGNHDILAAKLYQDFQLKVHPEGLLEMPFYISHDVVQNPDHFTIHGHVHPGIRLHGLGRQSFALPCFCINETCMILPAFGQFTGCKMIQAADYNSVFVIGDGKVMQWK